MASQFRLCIATLLRAKRGECVVLLGMKCSSFTVVNMGTSLRAICCPCGDSTKPSVASANTMAARTFTTSQLVCSCHVWICLVLFIAPFDPFEARTMLLLLLATACGCVWLLEQPFQTLLRWYPRFRFITTQMRATRSNASLSPRTKTLSIL